MMAISTPVKALWVRCTAVWTIVLLSTAQCALQIRFGRLYRSYRMSRNAELGTDLKTRNCAVGTRTGTENWHLGTDILRTAPRNDLRNFRPLFQVRGAPHRSQHREVRRA